MDQQNDRPGDDFLRGLVDFKEPSRPESKRPAELPREPSPAPAGVSPAQAVDVAGSAAVVATVASPVRPGLVSRLALSLSERLARLSSATSTKAPEVVTAAPVRGDGRPRLTRRKRQARSLKQRAAGVGVLGGRAWRAAIPAGAGDLGTPGKPGNRRDQQRDGRYQPVSPAVRGTAARRRRSDQYRT